jgi:hypothetical protein
LASTKNQFREVRNSQKSKAAVATRDLAQLRRSPQSITVPVRPRLLRQKRIAGLPAGSPVTREVQQSAIRRRSIERKEAKALLDELHA